MFVSYIIDNENPVKSCPANQTTTVDVPGSTALIQWDSPTAIDNSGGKPTIDCNPSSGTIFDIGSTPVICTARDDYGNEGNCSFYIDIIGRFSYIGLDDLIHK